MSDTPTRHAPDRSSGGERVFSDDDGRLWSAAASAGSAGALVFACISDPRQTVRAIAMEGPARLADVDDETLRAWLREAPRMGRLT